MSSLSIYSASHTFDKLIAQGRIRYFGGLLAYRLSESGDNAKVDAWEDAASSTRTFEADKIYVACGAFGTTRLVLASLKLYDHPIALDESMQFVLPFLSAKRTPNPRTVKSFTLNQFNMAVSIDEIGRDVAQVHFYASHPEYRYALPAPLRMRVANPAAMELLRHVTLGLGYLPSWASPRVRAVAKRPTASDLLPDLEIGPENPATSRIPMLREVFQRITRAAPYLDLMPVKAAHFISAPGKSYHFGGSFSHTKPGQGDFLNSDRLGRVKEWSNIHMVDGSVLPSIPAITFTLTVMANAHRIAEESVVATHG